MRRTGEHRPRPAVDLRPEGPVTAEVKAWRGSDKDVRAQVGRDIVDELRNQGWEVLQGDLVDPKTGDFTRTPRSTTSPSLVTRSCCQSARSRRSPPTGSKTLNRVLRVMEKGNTWWKGNVLPFPDPLAVGRRRGGMYMAWVGGGIPPWKMIDAWKNLRKMDEATAMQWARTLSPTPVRRPGPCRRGCSGCAARRPHRPRVQDADRPRDQQAAAEVVPAERGDQPVNHQGYLLAKLQEVLTARA